MEEAVDITAEDSVAIKRSRRDNGSTFIELLVSIVLLGTSVIAVLVALQATTIASTVDADHARAFVWLHDASDAVFEIQRESCNEYLGVADTDPDYETQHADIAYWTQRIGTPGDTSADGTVWGIYSDVVESTPPPQGWSAGTIAITSIEFLQPTGATTNTFEWGPTCYEGMIPDTADDDSDPDDYRDTPLLSQKIRIEVRGPQNDLVKALETVKGDR